MPCIAQIWPSQPFLADLTLTFPSIYYLSLKSSLFLPYFSYFQASLFQHFSDLTHMIFLSQFSNTCLIMNFFQKNFSRLLLSDLIQLTSKHSHEHLLFFPQLCFVPGFCPNLSHFLAVSRREIVPKLS